MQRHFTWTSLLLLGLATTASAEPNGPAYVGLQAASITYSDDRLAWDAKPSGLVLQGGVFVHENFAVEGRFGGESTPYSLGSYSVTMDQLLGVYGRGHANLTEMIEAYYMVGLTRISGTFDDHYYGDTYSDTTSDASFGVGFTVIQEKIGFGLEWIQYTSGSQAVDALSLTLQARH